MSQGGGLVNAVERLIDPFLADMGVDLVDVEWGRTGQTYPVAVHIEAWDRVGLLRDVSTMVSEDKVNMLGVRTEHGDRTTDVYLTLETTGVAQLSRLMGRVESVRGVITVNRQIDGARRATGSL